jgi:hypothetical protein
MRRTLTAFALVATAAALAPTAAEAQLSDQCWLARGTPQEAVQRTSPKMSLEFTVGGETAVLCYGAPSMRGREIFGGLERYGVAWRMGADEATAIHLPFGGDIGGVEVEAGTYSLMAVPGEESFEIIVNSAHQRWGVPITPDVRSNDIGSFTREVTRLDSPVERLTFSYEPHGENMGHLVMEWETTRVEIPIHKGM